jgi:type III restriction enzyme
VVGDSNWELKVAQVFEGMKEVHCYVKNQGLGFLIPYTIDGQEHTYIPDFIVRIEDGNGPDDLMNLIVEVSGEAKKEKAEKVATARTLWVPGINNLGTYGRWAFIEISDPWDAENSIRQYLGLPSNG